MGGPVGEAATIGIPPWRKSPNEGIGACWRSDPVGWVAGVVGSGGIDGIDGPPGGRTFGFGLGNAGPGPYRPGWP